MPMKPRNRIDKLRVQDVVSYLERHGWQVDREDRSPNATVYLHEGRKGAAVAVPRDRSLADYTLRMDEVLETVADLEGRDAWELLEELRRVGGHVTDETDLAKEHAVRRGDGAYGEAVPDYRAPMPVTPVRWLTAALGIWCLLSLGVAVAGVYAFQKATAVLRTVESDQRLAENNQAVASTVELASYWNELDEGVRYRHQRFVTWQKSLSKQRREELLLFFIDPQKMNDAAAIQKQQEIMDLLALPKAASDRDREREVTQEVASYRYALTRMLNTLETVAVFRQRLANKEAVAIVDEMFRTASTRYAHELTDYIRLYRQTIDDEAWMPLTALVEKGPWATTDSSGHSPLLPSG